MRAWNCQNCQKNLCQGGSRLHDMVKKVHFKVITKKNTRICSIKFGCAWITNRKIFEDWIAKRHSWVLRSAEKRRLENSPFLCLKYCWIQLTPGTQWYRVSLCSHGTCPKLIWSNPGTDHFCSHRTIPFMNFRSWHRTGLFMVWYWIEVNIKQLFLLVWACPKCMMGWRCKNRPGSRLKAFNLTRLLERYPGPSTTSSQRNDSMPLCVLHSCTNFVKTQHWES